MSDLNELMSKGERDVTPLEACVRDMAFRGNGAAAELAAEQLARKDVEIAALRADNARLQAIEAAAREAYDAMQSLPFAGNILTAEHVRKLAEAERRLAAALDRKP
jgi:hypothetical protein